MNKRIFKAASCLLLACALMLSMCSCAFWQKTFAKPNKYMAYVEEEAASSAVAEFAKVYDKMLKSYSEPKASATEGELRIGLGKSVSQILSSYTGINFDFINDTVIKVNTDAGKDAAKYAMSLVFGKDTLLSLDTVMDTKDNGIYVKLGDITEKYLFIDASSAEGVDTAAIIEKLPDGEALSALILKYIGIVFDNVNEAEKTTGEVTANGKTEECTVLEATLSEAEVKALLKTVAFELQRDAQVENIIRASVDVMNTLAESEKEKLDADEVYSNFVGEVNSLIADIDEDDTSDDVDEMLKYTSYVNKNSEVIARKLWVYEMGEMFIGTAYEGEEFGTEISLAYYLDESEALSPVFEVKGEGKNVKNIVNGEFDVYADGELMLSIELSDFNNNTASKDRLIGSVNIYPSSKLFESVENSMISAIGSSLSVGIDFSYKNGAQSIKISVKSMESELVSFTVTGKEVNGGSVFVPAESEATDDAEAWLAEADFAKLLDTIRASELPADIKALIESFVSMLSY